MSNQPMTIEKIMNRIKTTLFDAQKKRIVLQEKSNNENKEINRDYAHHFSKLLLEIDQNNRKWNVNPEFLVTSHRPKIGRIIVFGKKVLRKILRWYINPPFRKQSDFNGSVTRSLNLLSSITSNMISDLEAQNENQQMKQMKQMKQMQEIQEVQLDLKEQYGLIKERSELLEHELKIIREEFLEINKQLILSNDSLEQNNVLSTEDRFKNKLIETENKMNENIRVLQNKMENADDMFMLLNARIKKLNPKRNQETLGLNPHLNQQINHSSFTDEIIDSPHEIDYFLFEQVFRGTRSAIIERQKFYLPYFKDKRNVLDIGCGRGEFIELLGQNGIKAKGIDLNEDMVGYCKEHGFEVELANALDYLKEVEDNTLDGIFMAQVIEHLSNEQALKLLDSIYRVLKPGGLVAIETINVQSVFAMSNWFYMDPTHIKPVHPATLKFILQGMAFSKVETQFLSPVLDKGVPPLLIDGVNTEQFNQSMQDVSGLLYGFQDYVICAYK